MRRIWILGLGLGVAACERVETGVEPDAEGADMGKYVAMGTSISMGYANDGVVAATQETSWPKLLANNVGVTFTQPLIESPGCQPPFTSPLIQLKRLDNSSALTTPLTCAANAAGVALPAQNVAITGQTALDATTETPTNATVTARVLAAGQTQVTAMRAQNPTFVSVEFGGAELLQALNGRVEIGTTLAPIAEFQSAYGEIIDAVKQTGAKALLVTLPTDLSRMPAVRTSAEVAAQRSAFALLNVSVSSDCDTSPNYVTLLGLLGALANGAARVGQGAYTFSCANVANVADGILSPAEVTTLNNQAAQYNTFITTKANENGYATMSLGVLYDNAKVGAPFDLVLVATSQTPFGATMSLDGVHPNAAGNAILASAARAAITAKYGGVTK
ncbi:MAG TPA: SGNH/GDSL hydrolase family protein [Gemmatimonadaceae bacterium]